MASIATGHDNIKISQMLTRKEGAGCLCVLARPAVSGARGVMASQVPSVMSLIFSWFADLLAARAMSNGMTLLWASRWSLCGKPGAKDAHT